MANSEEDYKTNYKDVNIKTSEGNLITGKLNISPYERVSDLLQEETGQFIVLVGARGGGSSERTMFINKRYIIWIEPED